MGDSRHRFGESVWRWSTAVELFGLLLVGYLSYHMQELAYLQDGFGFSDTVLCILQKLG